MKKPTFDSVTGKACKCDFLKNSAENPDLPIVYAEELNEYHLKHSGEYVGFSMIYHCPWCGGVAPKSKRSQLFAKITRTELKRLEKLISKIKSVEEAIAAFGEPAHDDPQGTTVETPATSSDPPRIEIFRTLTFEGVSKVADVHLEDHGPKGVKFSIGPKYIGDPNCEV